VAYLNFFKVNSYSATQLKQIDTQILMRSRIRWT